MKDAFVEDLMTNLLKEMKKFADYMVENYIEDGFLVLLCVTSLCVYGSHCPSIFTGLQKPVSYFICGLENFLTLFTVMFRSQQG